MSGSTIFASATKWKFSAAAMTFISLVMYLTERRLFFSVNPVFSSLTGHRDERDFDWFASYVPALEARNGQMCRKANADAANLAARFGKVAIAGSDSHAIAG